MRISILRLTAYYLYQVIAEAEKGKDKSNDNNNTEPEPIECNPAVTYIVDKNLSKKPTPFSSSDFRDWAKNNKLILLQESYTLVNPGKVAEAPGPVIEGLDKAANAPGKANVANLYLPKPDYDYADQYDPNSKGSKKSNSSGGSKDNNKDKNKSSDQKDNDQKGSTQKTSNDKNANGRGKEQQASVKKKPTEESSSSSSSDDTKESGGSRGKGKAGKESKLKADFFSDDSFLKGSSWKDSPFKI